MACGLSTFPFLTALEFAHACRVLADRACACTTGLEGLEGGAVGGWSSIRLVTQNAIGLKITRRVDVHRADLDTELESVDPSLQDAQDASALDEEEDPVRPPKFSPAIKGIPLNTSPQEALVRTDGHPKLHIEYEILLSPTYQVPVLYFVLHWDNQGPIGLDAVYRYLVPESYRKQLKNVGVMGGISFGVGGIPSPPPLATENETKRST
ncbi:hypothetical protein N7481_011204 [Penicillium waksmanii]|uniref:uncharacterized protein n=1 Tax=Penicillium waksmanii TaxID=69791 RepID=UPI002549A9F2|nr:uncharacterized protein N7481_011204 [Penicillium waksmanii]KAJ5973994.1 hypothetical protein N7481_011204 [Penicillium waksmanii]